MEQPSVTNHENHQDIRRCKINHCLKPGHTLSPFSGVLLTLTLFLTLVQFSSPCPASCIVCSEDAIICNKLSNIVEAPDSTKALMLTGGLIDTVSSIVFSSSSNMSVLALSNNLITTIHYNAFQNLTALRTLMLDHNLISTQALNMSTFSWLRQLETLHLGNNALRDISGSWFQNAGALRTLLLEGNLITSIDSSTFASSDLRNLEILDLSDNLVAYLGRNSFRSLPRLRSLDLSRNKLQNAPDAFSYLTWLSMLNLDYNRWNCTCQLRELASFLSSYVQSPDRVLYNGQRLACTSSDNPAVQTVLELTDANCVAANSNITVTAVAKGSITPRRYVRDIAVTAACSFLGGVGITLGIFALAYRSLGKRFRLLKDKNDAEERCSQASVQWEVSEGKEALSMACSLHNSNYRGHQPWTKDNNGDTTENQFICHNCSSTTLGTGYQEGGKRGGALLQGANHMGIQYNRRQSWSAPVESDRWKETKDDAVQQSRIKDIRAQRCVERGNVSPNRQRLHLPAQENVQGGVSTDMATMRMQQLALRRQISVSQRQTFTPKDQIHQRTQGNHINNISILKQHHEEYGGLPVYQTINCLHCHQTYEYRQAEHENQDTLFINHNEGGLPGEKKVSETVLFRDSLNYQSTTENQGREQRSVTFDLSGSLKNTFFVPDNKNKDDEAPYRFNKIKMSKAPDLKNNLKSGKTSTKLHNSSERKLRKTSKSHKPSTQLSRKLKVKLNLNPLRRNRIHSISSHEENDADQTQVKSKKGKNLKSKKDKSSKKSGSNGRKDAKGSENSDDSDNENENENEEEIKEEEEEENNKSKNKSSKRKASKKNDEKPKRIDKKDDSNILNYQNDANVPANGENQADANANSSETQGSDLSTAMAPNTDPNLPIGTMEPTNDPQEVPGESSTASPTSTAPSVVQEYLSSGDGSPKRRIRLIIPEKPTSRPQTALEKKIR
ncbi:uncharacterized protein lrrc53 [Astyanax mexicanus]|uniref:uncharacterized protein lrrc53 n=1 Tax=Astyanax mexicanus TaxID=7994 RepID=UPI0020CB3A16|nr:uncharacterized protein lrrc53 [Astyanax mexicanus]